MIELINIKKYFGNDDNCVKAIDGVSLTVEDGEMVAIMGASGSGKSTLLNIIGGLDIPTSGEYFIDGLSTADYSYSQLARMRNENFGFVMQDFAVVSEWNVYQNVQLPLIYSKDKRFNQRKEIDRILKQLGIYEKRDEPVKNLSGGQKQRVAIARAVINNPRVILADEPTGSLDSKTSIEVLNILKEFNLAGTTVIIVTHNHKIAEACQRVIYLRDGKIVSNM